ncbi:hypothetical protein A2U01_0062876, partial [Trifolium medium]|nr:hypothetical protein [Trifolium medium]
VILMKFVMFEMVKAGWMGDGVVSVVTDLGEEAEFLVGEEEEELFSLAMVVIF